MNHKKLIELMERAQFIDTRTGVKGSVAYRPLGMQLRNQIVTYWRETVSGLGYQEVAIPNIIPEKNFEPLEKIFPVKNKLFSVRHQNKSFYLKPTGECAIYPIVKQWIRETNILPLKIFQIGPQWRPHKDTSVMLNGDEQLSLMEAHSFHETEEEALREFDEIVQANQEFTKKYGLPYRLDNRCEWKNKPFYEKECSVGSWLFSKNRSFCNSVIYYQGNRFSKLYDIKTKKGFTFQNTFGVNAERILLSTLSIYSTEDCLVIPPKLFPRAFRTKQDPAGTSKRFGFSLVIGEKKAYRIDTNETIPATEAVEKENKILAEIQENLERRAKERFESVFMPVNDKKEIIAVIDDQKLAVIPWCGCQKAEEFEGNMPGEMIGYNFRIGADSCAFCGKPAKRNLFAAKRTTSP